MHQFIRVVVLAAGCLIGSLTLASPTSAIANTHLVHPGDSIQATVDAIRTGRSEPIPFQEVVAGTRATFALRASVAVGDAVALSTVRDAVDPPASA